jgi:hypothetical protein
VADLVMDLELGTAYGFVGLEELGRYRIDQVENGQAIVTDAIQKTLDFTNRRNELYRGRLSTDVNVAKEWYEMPSGGTLQDLDEHGNDVAFPIRGAGDATGTDRVSRRLQTFAEANRATQQATLADKRWHINYMLAAIFGNTGYPFLDRGRRMMRGAGRLDIRPLANGDDTEYIINEGAGVGTDNHYLVREGQISAANDPFPEIHEELVEHSDGAATDEVEVYVSKDLIADIEALPNFREPRDSRITYGSGESTVAYGDKGIGDEYVGYVSRCHIIRMNAVPEGYMLALAKNGRPLGYRQYPSANLQGLFQESHSPDGNHLETRFLRYGGYGVRNRTAALVMQVGVASGASYTPPALPAAITEARRGGTGEPDTHTAPRFLREVIHEGIRKGRPRRESPQALRRSPQRVGGRR